MSLGVHSPSATFRLCGSKCLYGLMIGYMGTAILGLKLRFAPYEYKPVININEHPVEEIKRWFDWRNQWPLL